MEKQNNIKKQPFQEWSDALDRSLEAATQERLKQLGKWGHQFHDLTTWSTILGEEYGEFCKEILKQKFDPLPEGPRKNLRQEAVQVAAVALAIVQYIDTGEA